MQVERGLVDWFKHVVFDNYANFHGRARRSEYWYFVLAMYILMIPFMLIVGIGAILEIDALFFIGFVLYVLFALALIVPQLAVQVRRLHDTSHSGLWLLVSIVPIIGPIMLFIFLISDSVPNSNKWGPNPKHPYSPDVIDHFS